MICGTSRYSVIFPFTSTVLPFSLSRSVKRFVLFDRLVPYGENPTDFTSILDGILSFMSKRDLGVLHDRMPALARAPLSGASAVPQDHKNPGKYACSGRARLRKLPLAVP